jgi:dipeptidyl aminopeptidase/acylaminoacyl peptidase
MTEQKKNVPYGLWNSPISPELISQAKRIEDVQCIPASNGVVWVESLSGKASLMLKYPNDAPSDLTGSLNPAGGVGYGGGAFCAGRDGVVVVEKNGRLYFKSYAAGEARVITPGFGSAAAPVISPDGQWVAYVQTYEGRDVIALVDIEGQHWPTILASGADFYMQPNWSPCGDRLAWIEWNHPNMPWDETSICHAPVDLVNGRIKGDVTKLSAPGVAYFAEKDELCLGTLDGAEQVLVREKILLSPAWVQGERAIGWSPDGRQLYFIENNLGQTSLHSYDLHIEIPSPVAGLEQFSVVDQPSIAADGSIVLFAESNWLSKRLIVLTEGKAEVIARTQADSINPGYLPNSQPISWRSSDNVEVHGLYFAPTHPTVEANGAPPVIVYIHGGPTSQVMDGFFPEVSYFTSRGYGFFAINYRGSTGYGRAYRQALNGHWGDIDVQDTIEGCTYLIAKCLADPSKLVIKGGSAGGYTVLNALVRHPGFFKAGLCSYGVSNLFLMDMDTHKFEAYYTKSLVGALPEAAQKYHDWSPVFQADQIRDALAVFQGSDDEVIPPNQSESIVTLLKANHIPHVYRLYEGEGHGFRKAENILDYYQTIDVFLKQYVIFSV